MCAKYSTSASERSSTIGILPCYPLSKSGINVITNVRMWKHSLKSRTEKYNDYGTRDCKQRNTRNETAHFGYSRSKQMYSGDCPNALSAVWRRNLPHGAKSLRTTLHQPPHLAGLSEQGHPSLYSNRKDNTLPSLRY